MRARGARSWAGLDSSLPHKPELDRRDRYVAIAMASPSPARKTNAIVGRRPADDGHRAMSAEPRAVSGGPPRLVLSRGLPLAERVLSSKRRRDGDHAAVRPHVDRAVKSIVLLSDTKTVGLRQKRRRRVRP